MDIFIETFDFCFKKATKIFESALEQFQITMERQEQE